MALFFNIENLEKEAKNDPQKFMRLITNFYYGRAPKRTTDIPKLNLKGVSFLLEPHKLFSLKNKVDVHYIVQYIKLAAKRDYTNLKYYNSKTLQLSYYPDLDLNSIKQNPLLSVTETEIIFKLEGK